MPADAGIGASNLGFMLSFVDLASPQLLRATKVYYGLSNAMDAAIQKSVEMGPKFERGTRRVVNSLSKVSDAAYKSAKSIGIYLSAEAGKKATISLPYMPAMPKIRAFAEGGLVRKPTIGMIGEKGPEIVMPLKKFFSDFIGKFSKMSGKGGVDKGALAAEIDATKLVGAAGATAWGKSEKFSQRFFKGATNLIGLVKSRAKIWSDSFGENAKDTWEDIDKSADKFGKGLKDLAKGGALIQIGTHVGKIKDAFHGVRQAASDVSGIEGMEASYTESARSIQKVMGWSRDQLRTFMKDEAKAMKTSSVSIQDQMAYKAKLFQQGYSNPKELKVLTDTASALGELTGMDLTEELTKLDFSMGFSVEGAAKWSRQLYDASMKVKKGGMQINFDNVVKSSMEVAGGLEHITKGWSEVEKQNMMKTVSSMTAGFQSMGLQGNEASALITKAFGDSQGQIELMKVGLSPGFIADSLKKGDAAGIIKKMGLGMKSMKPESLNMMLEKLADIGGLDIEVVKKLANNMEGAAKDATTFGKTMGESAFSVEDANKKIDDSRSTFDKMQKGISNFVQGNAVFTEMQDIINDINPMKMWGIVEAGKGLFKIAPAVGKMTLSIGKYLAQALFGTTVTAAETAAMYAKTTATVASTAATDTAAVSENLFQSYRKKGLIQMAAEKAAKLGHIVMTGAQTAATAALTVATGALNFVMSMNPIALVVIGVVALVAAFVLAYKKCETFRNIVNGLWEILKGVGSYLMEALPAAIQWLWDKFLGFGEFLKNVFVGYIDTVSWPLRQLMGLFMQTPGEGGFFDWILAGVQKAGEGLGWIWDKIKGFFKLFGKEVPEIKEAPTTPAAVAPAIIKAEQNKVAPVKAIVDAQKKQQEMEKKRQEAAIKAARDKEVAELKAQQAAEAAAQAEKERAAQVVQAVAAPQVATPEQAVVKAGVSEEEKKASVDKLMRAREKAKALPTFSYGERRGALLQEKMASGMRPEMAKMKAEAQATREQTAYESKRKEDLKRIAREEGLGEEAAGAIGQEDVVKAIDKLALVLLAKSEGRREASATTALKAMAQGGHI